MKIGASLVLAVLAVLAAGCGSAGEQRPPHIFLVTADALRADHLSGHGYRRETSPRIDAFASEAWDFRDAVTVIPKTGPSFATIFSGRHPEEHGVRFNKTRPPLELPMLAERLQAAGYRTAAFVSNPVLRSRRGFARGFDTYEVLDHETGTASVNRRFLEWAERDWSEPTFVWLHYIDPHGPYTPPEEFEALFIDDEWAQSDRRVEVHPKKTKVLGAIPSYQGRDGETRVDKYVAWYDAEIRYVDSALGEIIDSLRGRGLYDDGVVVFTSDHGESLTEHDYYFEHGWYAYEASLRVPLVIKAPRQHEGRAVADAVSNLDILPTLLALAGLEPDPGANGVDLLEPIPARDPVVVESSDNYPEKFYGLRSSERKYLFRESDRAEELYDLIADPGEIRNLAEPDVLTRMGELCARKLEGLRANAVARTEGTDDEDSLDVVEKLRSLGYVD